MDIFDDGIYKMCMELAHKSKGDKERYGAVLVKDGVLIGTGYNRAIAHTSFAAPLVRIIKQGYVNHAEVEAMNDALLHGEDIEDSIMYVAGYFPKEKKLFLHETFTCALCAKSMYQWGVTTVCVPAINGWTERPIKIALEEAQKLKEHGKIHDVRLSLTLEGNH
jgi:deoxycytidylate deaminase